MGSVTGDAYMAANASVLERFALPYIGANLLNNAKQSAILNQLGAMRPKDQEEEHSLLAGLVEPQDVIVLVCPIDSAAPKGRLILPQVQ